MNENISSFFDESKRYFNLQLQLSEKAKEIIDKNCRFEIYKTGKTLFHQNQVAENLYFLVNGKAEFTRTAENQNITFAVVTESIVPLGVSGLNSPGRYMSNLTIKEDSKVLVFPLSVLYDLLMIDQISGSFLMSFILSRSTELLEFSELLLFPANKIIINEGDPCEDLIILFSGSLEVTFSFKL